MNVLGDNTMKRHLWMILAAAVLFGCGKGKVDNVIIL